MAPEILGVKASFQTFHRPIHALGSAEGCSFLESLMSHAQDIAAYLAGPALLRQAVAGMTDAQLDARPVPGKMSTREVVCHIADFEPVYADRMKRALAEHEPPLRGGDPEQFRIALAYDKRDVAVELDLISTLR